MARKVRNPVDYGVCITCGFRMLPILAIPPCGHQVEVERKPLTEIGEVYSWTRMRLGEDRLIVMGDFFDGELRVTAPLLDVDSVEIGDAVRLVEGEDTPYAFVLNE